MASDPELRPSPWRKASELKTCRFAVFHNWDTAPGFLSTQPPAPTCHFSTLSFFYFTKSMESNLPFYLILKLLSSSQKDVIKFKNSKEIKIEEEKKKLIKILRMKFTWFFNISLAFLILFWYYLSCFCAVYKNTHMHLLKDTLISFGLSLMYPFGIYLIPGIFRIPSLKKKNLCLYKIDAIAQLI